MNDMRKCPTCGALCNVVGKQEFEGSAVMSVLLVPACDDLVWELALTAQNDDPYDLRILARFRKRAKAIVEVTDD